MTTKINDLVSIIMPAYNCANVIEESINSVLSQSYQHWELCIVDDCSTDDTYAIVREYALNDPRIIALKHDRNSGPARARNSALQVASGRWVAFLDSDDLWLPSKLKNTIEFATRTNCALVYTGFRRFDASGQKTGRYISVPPSLTYKQLLSNTAIATSTVLIDLNQVGTINMRDTYYDDFDCWLQILKRGFCAYGLNQDLMRYRVMSGSISRNKSKSAIHVWKAYRQLELLPLHVSIIKFIGYATRGLIKYLK